MDHHLLDIALQLVKLSEQLNLIVAALVPKSVSFDRVLVHLMDREGVRLTVYKDTLGIPTVGVGHVVRPEDNLVVGNTITKERVNSFLQHDALFAFEAAFSQLIELGLNSADFLVALTSVNFQLGTGWRAKFPKTWALIKEKHYTEAATEVANSLWFKQTPVRVKDFQTALRALEA